MRVVSGFLKGKKIDFLKSSITRPLRDFVKENIFNIINHSSFVDVRLKNANVLDLYSGVGSFGIECISQGSKKSTFVENDNKALAVLNENLNNLKITDQSSVFDGKIISFFNRLMDKNKFEIIFLDPPFAEDFFIEELKLIKDSMIYKKNIQLLFIEKENLKMILKK